MKQPQTQLAHCVAKLSAYFQQHCRKLCYTVCQLSLWLLHWRWSGREGKHTFLLYTVRIKSMDSCWKPLRGRCRMTRKHCCALRGFSNFRPMQSVEPLIKPATFIEQCVRISRCTYSGLGGEALECCRSALGKTRALVARHCTQHDQQQEQQPGQSQLSGLYNHQPGSPPRLQQAC